jgi:site-specific DNA recombinase
MTNANGKPIRFASLIRVSTERQQRQGESLRVQKTENNKAVDKLGGRIVGTYGGQEHGTRGWEKAEVDRLLADGAKNKFDAVIVHYADRWSRDNLKSEEGLNLFKEHGIRFFVGDSEYDLFDEHKFFTLALFVNIGQLNAAAQNRKSLEAKIVRAKDGIPSSGNLPYGRTFDKRTKQWGIDTKKQRIVQDAAKRYLAGESLAKLADEHRMDTSNLHHVLTNRCGSTWTQVFHSKSLNIHHEQTMVVPPLLDLETIDAVKKRAKANKTYTHGQPKNRYLLSRVVFCATCGYTLFGQTVSADGVDYHYYRHAHKRKRKCEKRLAWVNADDLDDAVFQDLFDLFGNAVGMKKAIYEAFPDAAEADDLRERLARAEESLGKVKRARDKIIRFIVQDRLTEEQAKMELDKLNRKESDLQVRIDRLNVGLERVPAKKKVDAFAKKVATTFQAYSKGLWIKAQEVNTGWKTMTWEERRGLIEMVFSGETDDGKRMGVFVSWGDDQAGKRHKVWKYRIIGHLVDRKGRSPALFTFADLEKEGDGVVGGLKQRELLKVTSKVSS